MSCSVFPAKKVRRLTFIRISAVAFTSMRAPSSKKRLWPCFNTQRMGTGCEYLNTVSQSPGNFEIDLFVQSDTGRTKSNGGMLRPTGTTSERSMTRSGASWRPE